MAGNPLHIPITRRTTLRAAAARPAVLALSPAVGGEADGAPFRHGVASGDPDATSVVLWTRVTASRPVTVTGEIARGRLRGLNPFLNPAEPPNPGEHGWKSVDAVSE